METMTNLEDFEKAWENLSVWDKERFMKNHLISPEVSKRRNDDIYIENVEILVR